MTCSQALTFVSMTSSIVSFTCSPTCVVSTACSWLHQMTQWPVLCFSICLNDQLHCFIDLFPNSHCLNGLFNNSNICLSDLFPGPITCLNDLIPRFYHIVTTTWWFLALSHCSFTFSIAQSFVSMSCSPTSNNSYNNLLEILLQMDNGERHRLQGHYL